MDDGCACQLPEVLSNRRGADLDVLVASVNLGKGLLDEADPEFCGVAEGVAGDFFDSLILCWASSLLRQGVVDRYELPDSVHEQSDVVKPGLANLLVFKDPCDGDGLLSQGS